MPQGWTAGPAPSSAGWTPGPAPDFTTTNEPPSPELQREAADPNTIGTVIRHWWQMTNPVTLGQMLPFPKAWGGSGLDHPITQVLPAMQAVKREADERWKKGDTVGASAKYVESLIPILGPMMSDAGNRLERGEVAAVAGQVLGALTPAALSKLPPVRGRVPAVATVPAERAADVAFAEARGIPMDLGTATGNRFVRGAQAGAEHTPIGAVVGAAAGQRQTAALKRVAGELATEAAPTAVSAGEAGAGVRAGVQQYVRGKGQDATRAYTRLREIEAQAEGVPYKTAEPGTPAFERLQAKIAKGAPDGKPLSADEIVALRKMEAELDAMGFSRRLLKEAEHGSSLEHVEGTGGAGTPLYDNILQAAPGLSTPTRAEVQHSIRQLLEEGKWTDAAQGAVNLARAGWRGGPRLPASTPGLGTVAEMRLPIDLSEVKQAIQPVYDSLQREAQLAPLMGGKAEALRALDRVLSGPDQAPLMTAEAALGDLKSLARTNLPDLRTPGQGIASKAVQALQETVDLHAAAAGDQVLDLLRQARASTKAKHQAGMLLKKFTNTEDVALATRVTSAGDKQVGLLRRVQDVAPNKLRDLGRAWLDQRFDKATEQGGFGHTDRLYADWQNLGPETKKLIFAGPGHVEALDRFFSLSKRLGDRINPSGTALTLAGYGHVTGMLYAPLETLGSMMVSGSLAKVLRSPTATRALTRGLSFELQAGPKTTAAMRAAVWSNVVQEARKAGVNLPK